MEPLIDNFIKAAGWSILHSLWQGALIYGILLLIITGTPKLRSGIRHNLAYLAQCLIFCGYCMTFYTLFSVPEKSLPLSVTSLNFGVYVAPYASELPLSWNSLIEAVFPHIVALYGVGLTVQLMILFSGYQKVQKLKQADRLLVPNNWASVFEEIKSAMNIGREVSFYLSSSVNVPLVIGFFKPIVLFPVALATQLDLKQVEAILIHELSHIRRNDYLLNLIKTVMETILFFNPFIWLSGRLIDMEREHACDDLVLKHTGTPLTYAHALLKLELLKNKNGSALSLAATGKTQHLYQRIKRITDMKTNYMNAKQRLLAMSLVLATVISLAWVSPFKPKSTVTVVKRKIEKVIEVPIFKPVQTISDELRKEVSAIPVQDTTKKKTRIKIVTTDDNGNTKEYGSLKEMPDSLRREVMVRVIPPPRGAGKQSDSVLLFHRKITPGRMHFDIDLSAKDHGEGARKKAEEIRKYYTSPEWNKHIEEITKHAKEAVKHSKEFDIHLNASEFKTQMLKSLDGDKIREKFSSEEWRKQMEELNKFYNSKEYKRLKEKQKKEMDRLRKKKGVDPEVLAIINTVPPLPPTPPIKASATKSPHPAPVPARKP